MASGFMILQDGRCFSVRWSAYDAYLLAIADELVRSPLELKLGDWLRSLVPTEDDLDHLGYGPWLRRADGEVIARVFDLRELAPCDQRLFEIGAQRAFTGLKLGHSSHLPREYLDNFQRLMRMIKYVRQGRPPAELSDWRDGYTEPPTGKRVGPGW
jgi:hypothetical protein